jgi:hypothetical protein
MLTDRCCGQREQRGRYTTAQRNTRHPRPTIRESLPGLKATRGVDKDIDEYPIDRIFVSGGPLGHTKVETTAKYLNVTAQYPHELNERKPLTLVRTNG